MQANAVANDLPSLCMDMYHCASAACITLYPGNWPRIRFTCSSRPRMQQPVVFNMEPWGNDQLPPPAARLVAITHIHAKAGTPGANLSHKLCSATIYSGLTSVWVNSINWRRYLPTQRWWRASDPDRPGSYFWDLLEDVMDQGGQELAGRAHEIGVAGNKLKPGI
jgi:hypothetical protein